METSSNKYIWGYVILPIVLTFQVQEIRAQYFSAPSERPLITETIHSGDLSVNLAAAVGALTLSIWGQRVLGHPSPSIGAPSEGSYDLRFSYSATPLFDPKQQWLGGLPDYMGYVAPIIGSVYYVSASFLNDRDWRRGSIHEAYAFAQTIAWTQFITTSLKYLVGRERPFVVRAQRDGFSVDDVKMRTSERLLSFPSGHSSTIAATSFFIAADLSDFLVNDLLKNQVSSTQVLIGRVLPYSAALITSWFVMYGRIKDQRHWLSDTLAGGLIGMGAALLIYHTRFDSAGEPHRAR